MADNPSIEEEVEHFAYISGPMSDIPFNNFPLFDRCELFLTNIKGWGSFSPANRDRQEGWQPKADGDVSEFDRNAAMRHDFGVILSSANCIVMLPGWLNSSGAKAERVMAQEMGLPVFIYSPADGWENAGCLDDVLEDDVLVEASPWNPWEPAHSLYSDLQKHYLVVDTPVPITGEIRTTSSTGGQKGVKPERLDLISPIASDAEGRILNYGLNKYDTHNWRRGYEWSKSHASMLHHINAWSRGEDLDPESGLPHLAHARCHTGFLLEWAETHPEFDDRYKIER